MPYHSSQVNAPPSRKYPRLTLAGKPEVELRLAAPLERDCIQLSSSSYAAPVMFVAEEDGGLRTCVDDRSFMTRPYESM